MDTYSSDDINLAPRIYSPENLQGVAHSRSGELRRYGDIAGNISIIICYLQSFVIIKQSLFL